MRHSLSLGPRILPALLLALAAAAWPQELPAQPQARPKVCVALVSNATTTSLFVERMTERLTKCLAGNKVIAAAMDSATTKDRELRPTLENSAEMKTRECDYVLLTQITDPKAHRTEPRGQISIGGKTPSVDASDPMGGGSGPVYRDNLEIDFALFRPGKPTAVTNATLLEQPSANVSDSLVQAMDRVANRVHHELKKK